MSHSQSTPSQPASPVAAIQLLLRGKEKNLGGFSVRHSLPNPSVKHIGP